MAATTNYDKALIKWAKKRWPKLPNITDVDLSEPFSYDGCETCGFGSEPKAHVTIWYGTNNRKSEQIEYEGLVKEILEAQHD